MAIKFLVDSASDILPEEAQKLGVIVLPMTITFGEKQYADCVDLSHSEFYEKLIETDQLPVTSQIVPAQFETAIEWALGDGDELIILALSSKLSGTYQSALIAASGYGGRVKVVDTENVCIGERLLLLRALALRDKGMSADEIVERLNQEKKQVRLLALLDTLEYLKKGGRISKTVAFAGTLLGIKPVVAVVDGEVQLVGKARGSKNGNNLLRELVQKSNGIDFDRPYCLGYSGLSDHFLQKYIADSAELWQGQTEELPIATVGCTIGTHVGPGAIAVALFEKESK